MSARVQQENIFFTESTTPLAASATFAGAARDVGSDAGQQCRYSAFNVHAAANVAGSVRIELSLDGAAWFRATADAAVAANGVTILSVPVTARFYRAGYTNGAAGQATFALTSSFTAA